MADITQVFKSTVKMVKLRQKTVNTINASGDETLAPSGLMLNGIKSNVGKTQPDNKHSTQSGELATQFSAAAKELVKRVTDLKCFLIKHRKAYLAASSNLPAAEGDAKMTDVERDKIDADAMNYMKLCKDTLEKCRSTALHKHLSQQQREHRVAVLAMIEEYLKVVCQIYSEQRAIRVKRAIDQQTIGRLELLRPPTSNVPRTEKEAHTPELKVKNSTVFDEPVAGSAVANVSPEEAQMFSEENEQLFNELNSVLNEVKQIEGKVVEISRLQEIFTEKVLDQEKDIDRISDALVTSTENITQGNQDIREAMKNNAGLRVWIIFGICVLSFTLLFLDWYND